jgi:hypothetical protein
MIFILPALAIFARKIEKLRVDIKIIYSGFAGQKHTVYLEPTKEIWGQP